MRTMESRKRAPWQLGIPPKEHQDVPMAQDPAKHTAPSHIKQFPEFSLPLPCVREMAKAYAEHVLDAYSRRYHGEIQTGDPLECWKLICIRLAGDAVLISTSGT